MVKQQYQLLCQWWCSNLVKELKHRDKWSPWSSEERITFFLFEELCLRYLVISQTGLQVKLRLSLDD